VNRKKKIITIKNTVRWRGGEEAKETSSASHNKGQNKTLLSQYTPINFSYICTNAMYKLVTHENDTIVK
jgi:hypothetical protein